MTELTATVRSPARTLELVAAEVARRAGEFVGRSVGHAAAAGTKSSPTDAVTYTDIAAEELIRDELLRRCPGSTILGEELADEIGENDIGWIVDPIDGTVNFLYDLPVVAVSIAATIREVVVAGAVVDVVRGETFSAARGGGATCDGSPLLVETAPALADALVGTGFAYDAELRATQAETLQRLLPRCRDIRCMGSAALNLCWVASGRLDAYFEQDIKVYDFAAGALIAAEAGASVLLPPVRTSDVAIAANPAVFDDLRDIVLADRAVPSADGQQS